MAWIDFESEVKAMFNASIEVQPGSGTQTLFWTDKWLEGKSIQSLAPDLCCMVSSKTRNNITLAQGLHNKQWIKDLKGQMTMTAFAQYLELWPLIQGIQLNPGTEDVICWRWTSLHQYTAKSAYRMFFAGSVPFSEAKLIWKSWAPPKVKFFLYLAMHGRTWTAERRFNMDYRITMNARYATSSQKE